jgi:hypothetical protein
MLGGPITLAHQVQLRYRDGRREHGDNHACPEVRHKARFYAQIQRLLGYDQIRDRVDQRQIAGQRRSRRQGQSGLHRVLEACNQ